MRLFIALKLPDAFIPLLKQAGKTFAANAKKISLTRAENLHLTLRFLGEVSEEKADELREFIRGIKPFETGEGQAALTGHGSFFAPGGLTLWAGLACDRAILDLANGVEEGAKALGFPPDNRPFVPHVTLARRAILTRPLDELTLLLPAHPEPLPLGPLTLFESRLGPEGPEYIARERIAM
ncbi:MAG: RNA 2',3'-cyclic phosphodiesterase [Eubacteriales bacterium]|nr:RNA 2',3'-cyclic phosphodiesterase [Eubacteriales bacterium]